MTTEPRPRCQGFGCTNEIPRREHQDESKVRTCSPQCAAVLFREEHPDWKQGFLEVMS